MEATVPGMRLGRADQFANLRLGDGVHQIGDYIFASAVGSLEQTDSSISVIRRVLPDPVPRIGDVVTVRITLVQVSFADAEILSIGDAVRKEPFIGRIRIEDVRSFEKDSVVLYDSFRPGDIVHARVLSVGGSGRSIYFTTAENELGVIVAKSASGRVMTAISWCAMQDPISQETQSRKVARV
jgi:exosome complex component CSL4